MALGQVSPQQKAAAFLHELELLQEEWGIQVVPGEGGLELRERDAKTKRRLCVVAEVEDRTVVR
jgi:hypothetical protein